VSNQLQRILVAAIGIPAALGLMWWGGLPLVALVTLITFLGTRELFHLSERSGVRPLHLPGLIFATAAPLLTWVWAAPFSDAPAPVGALLGAVLAPSWLGAPWPVSGVVIVLTLLMVGLFARAPSARPLSAVAVTLLGVVYTGLLPCALLLLRFDAGPPRSWSATWLVFFPLVVTWVCDSFAMWGGKAFGRAKLWPAVSPGKTRAGGVAGLVGGVLTAVLWAELVLNPLDRGFPLGQAVILGLVIATAAQIGDLVESLFKREAGVKDSSGLIPGHGGVLDRCDSLYFVLPVTLVMYRAFGIG